MQQICAFLNLFLNYLLIMHGMNNIKCAVNCKVPLRRTTYQQRNVGDNDSVCMWVSRGHFRLRLYPTFRDVRHGVVGVERHIGMLQNLPATLKRIPLRQPEIKR
jgi:hypothetical protein